MHINFHQTKSQLLRQIKQAAAESKAKNAHQLPSKYNHPLLKLIITRLGRSSQPAMQTEKHESSAAQTDHTSHRQEPTDTNADQLPSNYGPSAAHVNQFSLGRSQQKTKDRRLWLPMQISFPQTWGC